MPKKLHDELEKEAKRGLKGKDKEAYVYGTMNKIDKAIKNKRKK